jgi:hypothetical protein
MPWYFEVGGFLKYIYFGKWVLRAQITSLGGPSRAVAFRTETLV